MSKNISVHNGCKHDYCKQKSDEVLNSPENEQRRSRLNDVSQKLNEILKEADLCGIVMLMENPLKSEVVNSVTLIEHGSDGVFERSTDENGNAIFKLLPEDKITDERVLTSYVVNNVFLGVIHSAVHDLADVHQSITTAAKRLDLKKIIAEEVEKTTAAAANRGH